MTSNKETSARFKILQIDTSYFIFSSSDASDLRKERIIGALVGTMGLRSMQNEHNTLPLMLMVEQIRFMQEKGMATVVRYDPDGILHRDDSTLKAYEKWIQSEVDEQSQRLHQKKIEESLMRASDIAKGRKAKQSVITVEESNEEPTPKLTRQEHKEILVTAEEVKNVEDELRAAPVRRLKETEIIKLILLESPFLINDDHWKPVITPIEACNDRDRLRYRVFVDLWEKGYYLTSGLKFGGDFLVYPGDPLLYHASYIVICCPNWSGLESVDFARWCRLGTQVKKTVLLCSWDEQDRSRVAYKFVHWQKYE